MIKCHLAEFIDENGGVGKFRAIKQTIKQRRFAAA
jgi:hypothetical protein